MSNENKLAKRPDDEGEFQPNLLKEAKDRIAADAGAFVRYIDSIVGSKMGISRSSKSIYEQVMEARKLGTIDQLDDQLYKFAEIYYQGKIRLNPISVYHANTQIRFRITDLGIVEIDMTAEGSNSQLHLSVNGEQLGNGDAPFSKPDFRFFQTTDIVSRSSPGNYFSRITFDVLAPGWRKDESGKAISTIVPMRVKGNNGVYEYEIEYSFIPGSEGQQFFVLPETLKVQGQVVPLDKLLASSTQGTPLLGSGRKEENTTALSLHVITTVEGNLSLSVVPTRNSLEISTPNRPDIPMFKVPVGIDIATTLRNRFDNLLEDSNQ